ncbi:uncharacterized protein N7482_003179, partial [Penicillium canariense]
IAYIATVLYSPAALFVKTSLIYILIRVFKPFYAGIISLYCLLGGVICYYFVIMFVKIFICSPVSAYWTLSERAYATCRRQSSIIIADSVIGSVTDIAILTFPVVLTRRLQMTTRKKLRVIFLLGLGGVAVGFSLYRLVVAIHQRENRHDTVLFMRAILTGNAELGIGLICACLPALNTFTTHNRQHSSSSSRLPKPQSSYPLFEGSQLMESQLSSTARRGCDNDKGFAGPTLG